MKFIESYSLVAGAKISKPKFFEKFVPLPCDKYITLSTTSKQSKVYDRIQDTIDIIKPILDKEGISIIQIGGKEDLLVNGVFNFCGQTSLLQSIYIVNRTLLHLSVDSWVNHVAAMSDKKIVAFYSNNYLSVAKPYFGSPENQILLEPDREKWGKPSFSYNEPDPKCINSISPETIAKSVCKLLNLEYNYPYQSLFFGEHYNQKIVETVPNQVVNTQQLGLNTIIIRYDLFPNEQMLAAQIQNCKSVIITNQQLNMDLLRGLRPNINQIVYIVDKTTNPKEIMEYQKLGIKTDMISYLTEEELNEIKLDFCEIGIIFSRPPKSLFDLPELKYKNIDNLYYKSNKFLLSGGKIYLSEYGLKNDLPVANFEEKIQKITENSLTFTKELSHFCILEEIN